MAKKNLKKTEHTSERHEIAEDIVAIRNSKSFSQEKKDELIQGLLDKKELTQTQVCPFPQHKGYTELWNKFKKKPEQQKYMKENIRISADGKIEIIKMKKKFSILQAEANGKDIFKWEHKDHYGEYWTSRVTYLTRGAAERICEEKYKEMFRDETEVNEFISFFPGENEREKIFNFIKLFDLEKSGYLCTYNFNRWEAIRSFGYVNLSGAHKWSIYRLEWKNDWENDSIIYTTESVNDVYPTPFLVFERLFDEKELAQAEVCPFPQHEGYAKLWKKFEKKPEQQKYMKENIRISADGKIEIIKMKKKFSILQAEDNGKDIFKWEHKDERNFEGITWVTYMTNSAAEKVCEEQHKNLLRDKTEVNEFISFFPGEDEREKIYNFIDLFGLEKSGLGYLSPYKGAGWIGKEWHYVGSQGQIVLSRVGEDNNFYTVSWTKNDTYSTIFKHKIDKIEERDNIKFKYPFVVYEPSSA